MDVAVVGSGIVGVFTAQALIARGLRVTLLDVGETLAPERQAAVEHLRNLTPCDWPQQQHDLISDNATLGGGALPRKMHFGSDYIYASNRPFIHIDTNGSSRPPHPTYAMGGYSNIWGGAVLPVDACDMTDWPFSRAALEPHFRKIAQQLPLCGGGGTLAQAFPAYKDTLGRIDPGPQSDALLRDLDRASKQFAANGVLWGAARVAISTSPDSVRALPCNGCGQCFTGCVRESIFSAVPMLDEMIQRNTIIYRPGVFVRSIMEDGHEVRINALVQNEGICELTFDAVFVAAGPLSTTAILMRSAGLYDRPLTLKESQKFVLPALRSRSALTAAERPSITLAGAFVEAKVPALSNHWVHMQMIPMNETVIAGTPLPGLKSHYGRRLWSPILRRVMLGWVGMHSDHSCRLEFELKRGSDTVDTISIKPVILETARNQARLAAHRLAEIMRCAGAYLQPRMVRFSDPGSGTHCGSSFPMRAHPATQMETDTLGRPFGWRRVHAVDASVLPSIPGTTLAFTAAANAVRIAEQTTFQ
jgi:choline dehydrogenase-like flavoprotein